MMCVVRGNPRNPDTSYDNPDNPSNPDNPDNLRWGKYTCDKRRTGIDIKGNNPDNPDNLSGEYNWHLS